MYGIRHPDDNHVPIISKGQVDQSLVWKVTFKRTNRQYAIKEMSKVKIIDKKSIDNIQMERDILASLHSPFIVNLVYAFQDHDYLYLVMDLLSGGNLRYHLSHKKRFNEEQTTCTLLGLEYIHKQKVLHRDIKPENLVLDANGYVHITDFGIAKRYTPSNGKDTSGTMGYIAPEVLRSENHSYCVDFYAIGIIAYEFLFGHRPYLARTKRELRELILTHQAQVEKEELPNDWSYESADFINKLIQRKPKNRLGYTCIEEVKQHKWFSNFDWGSLQSSSMKSPYVPKRVDNFDKKYCGAVDKVGNDTIERYNHYLMDEQYEYKFMRFSFNSIPDEFKCSNNHLMVHQVKSTTNNNCSMGDVTTKDTNGLGNSSNSSALQQKLSRNKVDKKTGKHDKKFDCSRSLSYSGGTCSISMPSVHNNNNIGIKSNQNINKECIMPLNRKESNEHANVNNNNNEHNEGNNKVALLHNINNNNNSNIISINALCNNSSLKNHNNNIPANPTSFPFEREPLLPSYSSIRVKNKKSSVFRNNLSNNKKNTSFLLGTNSNSLSARRRSPISSSSHSKEKRITSSNSSKHLHINNFNQGHLVLDKKLPIINLSFTKRKNLFNNGNEQDLSFGGFNYAPQILNYSERRGTGRKIRNQFCNLNFYYGNNNKSNVSINQRQEQGSGYNSINNSSMNKSLYNGQSNLYAGKLKLTAVNKYNQNKSISGLNNM